MDAQIQQTLSSLEARNIEGFFAEDCQEACQKILSLIPENGQVGVGDSTTVRQIGINNILRERGIRLLDAFDPQLAKLHSEGLDKLRTRILKEATISDVFLTGTNALTQDGRLVNVDGTGNRVAGMFWGHPMSVVVVGRNKIVGNLDEAFDRIRNVIAPNHIWIRSETIGAKKAKTPCATTGKCSDCKVTDRRCNIFTIIEGKPHRTDLNVIIIDEDLGLGWDPSWPEDHINKIVENYKKFIWVRPKQ